MKKPEIRLLNGTEIVVLPDGWEEGGRFVSEREYLQACGEQYLRKRIMTRYEFRAHKNAVFRHSKEHIKRSSLPVRQSKPPSLANSRGF
ncbi:MAG: hypothetical protein Q4A21_02905 [bacterium]|nr:hypothetical protein [bacterium]